MNDDFLNNIPEDSEEDYEPVIVSVVDEEGEEHIFEELDTLELDDKEYVALLPVYDDDDLINAEDELIILVRNYDGDEIYLEPIEDEDEFMKVGQMFEDRLSDMFDFNDED